MLTDALYKIGVGESNGDVTFALGRHLAVKNYFRSDFKNCINPEYVQKGRLDRKNDKLTLIENRCRTIDWLPQVYSEAPLAAKTTSGQILKL